ncbi:MAG: hypothetical protein J5858_17435 [Lentisphaeria bacterium]|nr:hypothetical protein [Lentisphaeria bacterium]
MKAKWKMPKSPGPHSPKLAPLETEIMEQHLLGKTIAAIHKWLKAEKEISIAFRIFTTSSIAVRKNIPQRRGLR